MRECPEILKAAWELVDRQAFGSIQRREQRIAEMLIAAWTAQENRLAEAAIHALEEAFRAVSTFGGQWPPTLVPLLEAVRKRFDVRPEGAP